MNDLAGPKTNAVTDIGQVIDAGHWSGLQKFAVLIAALAIVLDGFANQVLGLSIPMLIKQWHASRDDFQWVQVVGYAGMAVGTIVFGAVGDRAGRRSTLIGCVLLFAVPTLAIAFVTGIPPLYPLRLIGGLGLGGCMPNATALLAELTPARSRPLAVTGGIVGIPVGGTLGGFLASGVTPEHWSRLYVIGGSVPLLIVVIMLFALPESPRFLAVRHSRKEDLVRLMARFGIPIDPAKPAVDSLSKPAQTRAGLRALFSPESALDTVGLWGAMFFTLLSAYDVIT